MSPASSCAAPPKMAETRMASKRPGKAKSISARRLTTWSTAPPKVPASRPSVAPSPILIVSTKTATSSDTRRPVSKRARVSRPRSSAPSQWVALGQEQSARSRRSPARQRCAGSGCRAGRSAGRSRGRRGGHDDHHDEDKAPRASGLLVRRARKAGAVAVCSMPLGFAIERPCALSPSQSYRVIRGSTTP